MFLLNGEERGLIVFDAATRKQSAPRASGTGTAPHQAVPELQPSGCTHASAARWPTGPAARRHATQASSRHTGPALAKCSHLLQTHELVTFQFQ